MNADERSPPSPATPCRWKNGARALFSLLALVSLSLPLRAAPESTPAPLPATNTGLTVVLDDNYPPYIFRDSQGTLQGYLVDSWKLWETKTGIPVRIEASEWSLAQQRMQRRQADVIDTLFKNEERLKTFDFGSPYAELPVSIYSHRGIGGIVDINTLRGFMVGVKEGDACVDTLQNQGIQLLQPYPSYEALIKAAIRSEIRVFCLDEPPANYLLYREHAEREFRRAFRLYSGKFHRAFHKGDSATLTRVEAGFEAFTAQEKQALAEKWMGQSLDPMQLPPLFFYALASLAGIGTLLLLWVFALRRAVRQRTEDLVATLNAIPDPMFECNSKGLCLKSYALSAKATARLPPINLLPGKTLSASLPADAAATCLDALKDAEQHGHSSGQQIAVDGPDGRHWFELSIARKGTHSGANARFVMLARDITARLAAEATVRRLAHYDLLTGLPNRATLDERMRATISRAKRQQGRFALMFLDIDRFKQINDTLGHRTGDQLLIQFAQRLRATLRTEDTLARIGGDEFVLVLPETSASGAARVAEKLIGATSQPFLIDPHSLICTVSIGIALYPDDGDNFDLLSTRADTAMYRAKSAGSTHYAFFGGESPPPQKQTK